VIVQFFFCENNTNLACIRAGVGINEFHGFILTTIIHH
jgi:hypothetical protein